MKKIFTCFIIALIFSIAYAAMPSFVEAVEVSNKLEEIERILSQADEKELEEFSNRMIQDFGVKNIAQVVGAIKITLGVMERKFGAEEKSLTEAERQKRLDEIESAKLGLWMAEAVERRQLELAEAKQKNLNPQKNSEEPQNSDSDSMLSKLTDLYNKASDFSDKFQLAKKIKEVRDGKESEPPISFSKFITYSVVLVIISVFAPTFGIPFLLLWIAAYFLSLIWYVIWYLIEIIIIMYSI